MYFLFELAFLYFYLIGKHCKIRPKQEYGSKYYNYKGFHSFILMAITDAQYRFIYVDVGVNGRTGDAGVWLNSDLRLAFDNGNLGIPKPRYLPKTLTSSPFTLVGDDAFPLTTYLMKPYSHMNLSENEQRFNYMLSRSRRVVENAFGILANRFQVLFTPIHRDAKEAIKVALACISLHNYLRTENIKRGWQDNFTESQLSELISENYDDYAPRRTGSTRKYAVDVRKTLEQYFYIFKDGNSVNN